LSSQSTRASANGSSNRSTMRCAGIYPDSCHTAAHGEARIHRRPECGAPLRWHAPGAPARCAIASCGWLASLTARTAECQGGRRGRGQSLRATTAAGASCGRTALSRQRLARQRSCEGTPPASNEIGAPCWRTELCAHDTLPRCWHWCRPTRQRTCSSVPGSSASRFPARPRSNGSPWTILARL
jgi:hypothetical protein